METAIPRAELASAFSFALEVLEESDHLGLDDNYARLLHDILQRRIDQARSASPSRPRTRSRVPLQPFPLPIESEQTL